MSAHRRGGSIQKSERGLLGRDSSMRRSDGMRTLPITCDMMAV
jgi:hypothetical protein